VTDQPVFEPSSNLPDTLPVVPPAVEHTPRASRASTLVALLVVAIIGGSALFVSGFTLGRLAGATPGTTDANQDLFRPFWDAWKDVNENYVGPVDRHLLIEGAIKGIFGALDDPFSQYLTEEEYRASLGGISGEFEGVGVEMAMRDGAGQPCDTISEACRLVITRVVRRSPAVAAGLREGDVVTVDVGLLYKGYHTDNAFTKAVGKVSEGDSKLMIESSKTLIAAL